MRLLRLGERVGVANAYLDLARGDPTHHVSCPFLQFFSRGDKVRQARAREKDGTSLHEPEGIDRRDGTAGAAEQDHVAARAQDFETLVESCLAYAVVDDVDAFVRGPALGLDVEAVRRVIND